MTTQQPPPSKTGSRRIPPPCWSDGETVALIEVYRDKWYSLRRGNLRAPDWQEVADGVAARCTLADPPKTSIQCRHKMEKLRKRYRAEIQRIGSNPKGQRYSSSWVHFKLMDSMELGSSCSDLSVNRSNQEDDDDDDDDDDEEDDDDNGDDLMLYPNGVKQAVVNPLNRQYQGPIATGVSNGNGVRIKIPNFASNRSLDDFPPPLNPQYASGKGSRNGYSKEGFGGGMKRKSDGNVMNEMVLAIQKLGDRFVKMEKMKMDMARELESMRMKSEMKQTEMILETHQKVWDLLSETVVEKKNKKMKRMPTPES